MSSTERHGLILSFSEIAQLEQQGDELPNSNYATPEEAFYGRSIFQFVADEVHAMLQIIFLDEVVECWGCGFFRSFYNPIYTVLYVIFYALTLPGAVLHWSLLDFIQVREKENPDEREMRSQGIYTALGIAIISIPFGIAGLLLGTSEMILINEVALAVNTWLIIIGLIGLKAIADEKIVTIRVFTVGSWVLVLFLTGLALFDVYAFLTWSWITLLDYLLRIFEIFIYAVIAVHALEFWTMYEMSPVDQQDILLAVILGILYGGVVLCFIVAISVSEEDSWRIMYF